MSEAAFETMLAGAAHLAEALTRVIAAHGLSWSVVALGARVEIVFAPEAPREAGAMRKALAQKRLNHALHLYLINRGVLIAPFHMMMLVSPATIEAQIDRLADAIAQFAQQVQIKA
jgi:glutamate-1-semialdehyde 2,1-aminomutase